MMAIKAYELATPRTAATPESSAIDRAIARRRAHRLRAVRSGFDMVSDRPFVPVSVALAGGFAFRRAPR